MKVDKELWRNRKARKELARRLQSENRGLEVVHPRAAGIDVGNGAHYVAVRPDLMRLWRTTEHEKKAVRQERCNESKGLTPLFIAALIRHL